MTKDKGIVNGLSKGTILHGKTYYYEIIKVLGQGSFGITYLASVKMRGELGTIDATVYVAIKEFFMREINGRANTCVTCGSKEGIYDKYKKKFISEAKNLGKLQHENIIKVVEAFEENNTVYYYRVGQEHYCSFPPSEPYMRVSPHTAQAFLSLCSCAETGSYYFLLSLDLRDNLKHSS